MPAHADARRGKHPPRHAELVKLTGLRTEAKRAGVTVGPSLRRKGVRFVWVSRDGTRRHVGHRPATAREVAARIRELRRKIRAERMPPELPRCTWWPESRGDWRARNPTSTAGGRYQIIDSTWYAYGGSRYADSHPAAVAPHREQRRVAWRVLRGQGLSAWVNC